MSGPFKDYTFEWAGTKYTVPSARIMGGLCRVEEELTAAEVGWYFRERHSVPSTKLAKAISALINYARGDVTMENANNGKTPEDIMSDLLDGVDAQETIDGLTVVLNFLHQSAPKAANGAAKVDPAGEASGRAQVAKGSPARPSSQRVVGG